MCRHGGSAVIVPRGTLAPHSESAWVRRWRRGMEDLSGAPLIGEAFQLRVVRPRRLAVVHMQHLRGKGYVASSGGRSGIVDALGAPSTAGSSESMRDRYACSAVLISLKPPAVAGEHGFEVVARRVVDVPGPPAIAALQHRFVSSRQLRCNRSMWNTGTSTGISRVPGIAEWK